MGDKPPDMEWWELELKVREFFQKQAAEYRRLGSEFSKLVITNLHLINAGGLLALPAIATFTKTHDLPGPQKAFVLLPPVGAFILGVTFAALCALFTYFNYQKHSQRMTILEEHSIIDKRRYHPNARSDDFQDSYRASMEEWATHQKKWEEHIDWHYRAAHVSGWLSALCFFFASTWLAWNAR